MSNVGSAAVAFCAAAFGATPLAKIVAEQPLQQGVLTLWATALGVGLVIAAVTTLPATRAAVAAPAQGSGDIPWFRITASGVRGSGARAR